MYRDAADDLVETARSNTPGCATVVHLNNAGAGLLSARTLQVLKDYHDVSASRGVRGHIARSWRRRPNTPTLRRSSPLVLAERGIDGRL